jgi:hypothetical protein
MRQRWLDKYRFLSSHQTLIHFTLIHYNEQHRGGRTGAFPRIPDRTEVGEIIASALSAAIERSTSVEAIKSMRKYVDVYVQFQKSSEDFFM